MTSKHGNDPKERGRGTRI